MKELLCENYDESECPNNSDCTFWDCEDFKPTEYFMSGIEKLVEDKSE